MASRLRIAVVSLVVLTLLGWATPGQAVDAGPAGLTHLRVTLHTDSDWSAFELDEIDVRTHRSSWTPGATFHEPPGRFVLVPDGGSASASVDMVAEIHPGSSPSIRVAKGRFGTSELVVEVLNGDGPVEVLRFHLDTQEDPSVMEDGVGADTLDAGGLEIAPVDPRPLTLASYYPWFYEHHESGWKIRPDKPVRPFATNDDAQVQAMVDQAIDSGVGGFLVSWAGDDKPHVANVDLAVSAAAARPGFVVAPLLELSELGESLIGISLGFSPTDAARATESFLARVPPETQLRVDGRPVVFLFGLWSVGSSDWKAYLDQVAHLDPFVVGDRLDPDLPVSGLYHYDPNADDATELEARYRESVARTRLDAVVDPAASQKLWAATVSPGFDNRSQKLLLGRRSTDRAGGARYDLTWRTALRTSPDWVVVTSWNEWYEQTHIAVGSRTGSQALQQTQDWSSLFRQGQTRE